MKKYFIGSLVVIQTLNTFAWGISPESKEIGVAGATFMLEITNQGALDYTRGVSDSWITLEGDKVKVARNTENKIHGRTGYVQVNGYNYGSAHNAQNLDGFRRCYIFQYGQGASFYPTTVSLPGTNSSVTVNIYVSSDIQWEFNSDYGWLTIENGSGTGSGVITLRASENTGGTGRSVYVQIHDAGGDPSIPYNDNRVYGFTVTQGVPPEQYSITYENTRGVANMNPASYYKGTSVEFDDLPSVIDGYVFAGWSPALINETDSGDKIVTASWAPISYTISYDANGGSGETGNTSATYDSVVPISSNAFKWANHRFIGWATNANGNVVYAEGDSVSNLTAVANEIVTLYAVWEDYLEPPVFTPESGTIFEDRLSISISCASEEATIHYTTNGSNPTVESPIYRRFRIGDKTMVKAIAELNGIVSEIAVAEYAKGRSADPVISLPDGFTFEHSDQNVSISYQAADGILRYTLDGSDPTDESPIYCGSFSISESTTVKAKVFSEAFFDSSVVTAALNRVWVDVATPQIDAVATFTGSKTKVTLSCSTEGAIIRYTLNGTDPNSHSTKYSAPFYVDDSCTVKAYATKRDFRNSATATHEIVKVWCVGDTMGKPDHSFSTTGADGHGWFRVEDETAPNGEAMKSGAITHNQSSLLSTKVMGPGILSFSWRASCENDPDYEWDHAEFKVDGEVVRRVCGETSWQNESISISGDGEHTIEWWYIKDDVESEGEDSVWVAGYVWTSVYTTTQTSDVPVPYDWLTQYNPEIIDEYDVYESAAKAMAANGCKVWECYVAGTDPTDTNSVFTATITMVDGAPVVEWSPKLGAAEESRRQYTIYGKAGLESGEEWHSPTNALDRFFKVGVEMR